LPLKNHISWTNEPLKKKLVFQPIVMLKPNSSFLFFAEIISTNAKSQNQNGIEEKNFCFINIPP